MFNNSNTSQITDISTLQFIHSYPTLCSSSAC